MLQRALKVAAWAIIALALAGVEWFDAGAWREAPLAPTPRRSVPRALVPATTVASLSPTTKGVRGEVVRRPPVPTPDRTVIASAELATAAVSDPDPRVRAEAVHWLGESGGALALHTLHQALFDSDAGVRRDAVRSLARIGGEEAERMLASTLHAPEVALRLEALDALALMNPRRARPQLEMALVDDDAVMREAAAEWLEEIARAQ